PPPTSSNVFTFPVAFQRRKNRRSSPGERCFRRVRAAATNTLTRKGQTTPHPLIRCPPSCRCIQKPGRHQHYLHPAQDSKAASPALSKQIRMDVQGSHCMYPAFKRTVFSKPALTLSLLAVLSAALSACARNSAAQNAAPPPPQVTVAQVLSKSVTEFDEFTGRFEAIDRVEVRPRVSGYISSVNFTEGSEVKK